MHIFLKYFIAWFPMLVLAVANGALRDLVYKKNVGELAAHQISTFTLLLLFGIYIYIITRKFPPHSQSQAIAIGIFWMCLTLLFEFGFGWYRGNSWHKLFTDYNILKGRIWVLIPIALATGPYILYCFFSKHKVK